METRTKTRKQILAEVYPELEKIELARQKNFKEYQKRRYFIYAGAILFVFLSIYIMAATPINPLVFLFCGIGLVTIMAVYDILIRKNTEELHLKQDLGTAILSKVEPEWTYVESMGVAKADIHGSGLFNNFFSDIHTQDQFSGKYKHTNFQFSHVDFESPEQDSTAEPRGYLFLVADFHKNLKGRTIVLPDRAQQRFGSYLGKKIQQFSGWKGLELIYLEDPKFEHYFAVFGSDQIEARYVLTTKMMETLVRVKEKFGADLQIAFTDSKIYIALEVHPLMNFSPMSPIQLQGTFNHFFNRVQLAKYLMDELCLNDRLWEKE